MMFKGTKPFKWKHLLQSETKLKSLVLIKKKTKSRLISVKSKKQLAKRLKKQKQKNEWNKRKSTLMSNSKSSLVVLKTNKKKDFEVNLQNTVQSLQKETNETLVNVSLKNTKKMTSKCIPRNSVQDPPSQRI